jgi:hypothetical protein
MALQEWVDRRKALFDLEAGVGGTLTSAASDDVPLDEHNMPVYDRAGRLLEGTIFWMAKTSTGIEYGQAANRGAARE